ncbi:MAG: hypothetical protein ACXVKA_14585 [Acidimicrobiia bacterium]
MYSINEDWALQEQGREKVALLAAYEARHPRQGPDAEGHPYDPVRDVILTWLSDPSSGTGCDVDEVRTATIKSRTWEGFAWANHRFVVSDERGNALIIGYNEDARKWFLDSSTPVRLPTEWVADFIAEVDPEGRITGLEDPRELHDEIVRVSAGTCRTIPSLDEIAEYLRSRRAQ